MDDAAQALRNSATRYGPLMVQQGGPMRASKLRSRQAGFTYIEVTAAFVVLAIGVLGFAGTVIYTRNLDHNTTTMWRATAAASAALEDVREDSAGNWAALASDWDGTTVVTSGAGSSGDADLTATVNEDPATLDSGDGMWETDAATPNFKHVKVKAKQAKFSCASTLNFQTYVADRTGFRSLIADRYQGPPAGGTDAQGVSATPLGVCVTGATNNRLTFNLCNGTSKKLKLKSLVVEMGALGRFVKVEVNGTDYYDRPSNPRHVATLKKGGGDDDDDDDDGDGGDDGGGGHHNLNPGPITFKITGVPAVGLLQPILGQSIKVRLRMKDGSEIQTVVNP